MNLIVNGKPLYLEGNITVADFIMENTVSGKGTAIAINGKICLRSDWDKTFLVDGDNIIIISAAFGG